MYTDLSKLLRLLSQGYPCLRSCVRGLIPMLRVDTSGRELPRQLATTVNSSGSSFCLNNMMSD